MRTMPDENKQDANNNNAQEVDVVIVGGGQAGLAMSQCLSAHHSSHIRNHVVLERGRLVERWRSERWDSLRLLTPNWMTRLPGNYQYRGDDPDGFMTMPETIQFLETYAEQIAAPVKTNCEVISVERIKGDDRFLVKTSSGEDFVSRNIVVATGFCDKTRIPEFAENLPNSILQVSPCDYKRPSQILPGNVLIVGASATGCQIADEIRDFDSRSGTTTDRQITIAVGNHTRLPRSYRGKDILHWLYEIGFFGATCTPSEERQLPAPQIVGERNKDLDLRMLQNRGVSIVGKVVGLKQDNKQASNHTIIEFDDGLNERLTTADTKLTVLLNMIDEWIDKHGVDAPPRDKKAILPVPCPETPRREMDLEAENIQTIVWATGYERSYPWLTKLPAILDESSGSIREDKGTTSEPGVFVLGMRFGMTRISNFIDGVGADAKKLADMIAERQREDRKAC